ncbi:hypothetical protein [Hamadaea tsunoensis]|uniref:hypothetical protein n=1 Tax=Hamadaea tsunoensis TaxID=53368 RepID=UPI000413E473|nr:hypothetical protein [Hamadaea tsunoensis]
MSLASPRRRAFSLLIAGLVVLALGAGVAYGINGALGLSFTPVAAAEEHPVAAPERADVPAPDIARIVVPDEPRLAKAAAAVADALAGRGRSRPEIVHAGAKDGRTLSVDIGALSGHKAEAYRITGDAVEAADVAGAAAGLYAYADRVGSARALPVGEVVEPRLGLRLTDAGSVGREPDEAAYRAGTDYSLNTDVVGRALLPGAPWVDQAAVDRIAGEFRQFVDHSVAEGYNGIVVPGFLEYVTFAQVPGVYPAGDPHVARARAMVEAFGPVFAYAHTMGLKVFFLTDMLAVSPPLEKFLGGRSAEDPALWTVYQAGLAELFDSMPFADGLMIRIGEGGDVYKQAGWDYSSKIAVTTPAAVRAMLTAFLQTAGERGKDVIFRTWTVGVGAVGDLHTNPDSYGAVLGGLHDPHLVVSTKYSAGDFYSHLPLNPTLDVGDQRRIVEFQARREFEGFGALPNDLGSLEQLALQHFLAANPHVEGVWNWTQDGGPLHAGPMSLYLKAGFWPLYDLNTYATGRLAWDPETDPGQITADWARRTFSADPKTVAAIGQAMALSRDAVTQGLYLGPYAADSVKALGLEPPPMMWIFEWDIVTGDSAALDSIHAIAKDHVDEAIAEGENAVALARRMQAAVAATDPATWRDPGLRERFAGTLAYEVNLLDTLSAYRTMVLRHEQWLDTGSAAALRAWHDAEARYRVARDAHVRAYGGDVDLPAYNFTAADLGMVRADRDPAMAWLARVLLGLILIVLALRPRVRRALLRPSRAPRLGRLDRFTVLALPAFALVASRGILTWFAAPAHVIITLGGWALFVLFARLLLGRRDPFPLYATIGAIALARTIVLLVALVGHGPGGYWYAFWAEPGRRSLYITVSFALFAALFVAVYRVLRAQGALRRRSAGVVLAAGGGALAVPAALVTALGLERALTIWNDQMALLPWGLSRILGITVYLGIPSYLPVVALAVGGAAALVGLALTLFGRANEPGPVPAMS